MMNAREKAVELLRLFEGWGGSLEDKVPWRKRAARAKQLGYKDAHDLLIRYVDAVTAKKASKVHWGYLDEAFVGDQSSSPWKPEAPVGCPIPKKDWPRWKTAMTASSHFWEAAMDASSEEAPRLRKAAEKAVKDRAIRAILSAAVRTNYEAQDAHGRIADYLSNFMLVCPCCGNGETAYDLAPDADYII